MKTLASLVTSAALTAAALAAPGAASADPGRHDGYGYDAPRYESHRGDRDWDDRRRHDRHGDAIVAAVAGLAIGALIVSAANSHSTPAGVADEGYASPPPQHMCSTIDKRWDRYLGRYVTTERNYPC